MTQFNESPSSGEIQKQLDDYFNINNHSTSKISQYFDYSYSKNIILDKNPEVFLRHNKNRLKKYDDKVYLNSGSEFDIEIYNPSSSRLGILISLNGSFISESKLVIYPGQRIYLDRFINDNNKFLFKTYEVDNNDTLSDIIKNNGDVKILFYKERQIYSYYNDRNIVYGGSGFNMNNNVFYCSTNGNTNDNIIGSTTITTSIDDKIETGMIEKGSKSDQKFDSVYVDLNFSCSYQCFFKILPMSQKPLETKDLIRYCLGCKTKLKKDWNFCSKCGKSVRSEHEFNEITFHYTDLSVNMFKLEDDMLELDEYSSSTSYCKTYNIDLGYENTIKILSNKDKIYMIVVDDKRYMPGFFTIKDKKKEGRVILSVFLKNDFLTT